MTRLPSLHNHVPLKVCLQKSNFLTIRARSLLFVCIVCLQCSGSDCDIRNFLRGFPIFCKHTDSTWLYFGKCILWKFFLRL